MKTSLCSYDQNIDSHEETEQEEVTWSKGQYAYS